jgi:thiol:disulfide interchange protein DsbD
VKQAFGPFDIAVTSQGCADQGICYPPMERTYRVSGAALQAASANAQTQAANTRDVPWYERATNADYAQSLLESGGFFAIVGLYFVAGVVLSLLPCSYPMIPILSAIIIGEGARVTRSRGFGLSAAYVFGMALVYTALGVLAAMIGQSLGAWLQNPWVLGAFGVLLALFALTLIAGFDIALPARWQNSVNQASQKRSGGKVAAVVVMGALSALVVGACMTAPLFAVLAFIAHTGNALLGGAALFSMGVGLGVPLLIIGLGAGTLLPRAGNWMDGVKVFFGVVLLAAALWIVWPVLNAVAQMALAALWLLIAAAALGLFTSGAPAVSIRRRLGRGFGAALAIWGAALLVGLAAGATDPLRPLAVFAARTGSGAGVSAQQSAPGEVFAPVRSSAELDLALKAAGRPAMLDFYADWCVSCKEMEHLTFSDPRVRARLAQLNLLRADVTANNTDDQALLKRFKLFGPPGIIFFDAQGNEVARVVGYESADTFLKSLDKLSTPTT